jgi:multiple sugar transport system substrate-binding protein
MLMFMQRNNFCRIESSFLLQRNNAELYHKPKKEDLLHSYYVMLMPGVLTISAVVTSLVIISVTSVNAVLGTQDESNVTLTILFTQIGASHNAGKVLIDNALEVLRNETDAEINVKYVEFPYDSTRNEIIRLLSNQTPIDIITLDQIWLGELAQKGLLTDLTNHTTQQWDRDGNEEWYITNWEGGKSQGRIYGIWAWTDVRGIWYWKDMLQEAVVVPESLKTWDGYISAAEQLNSVLSHKGIEGIHLTGAGHSPDLWYPYLWMLGGDILQQRAGHPTKGTYWFPVFNSSLGVKALSFIQDQVIAGIKPQKEHHWGKEFIVRKFAVMIEGSWMPSYIQKPIQDPRDRIEFENRIGFLPMFPVPNKGDQNSTLMGGWEFSIPSTSLHKDLAWKLITEMLEPKILAPWLTENGFLPTQIAIGEGTSRIQLSSYIPYYDEMISAIPFGGFRPSIQEYPQIAEFIKEALDAVYYGAANPKKALDEAAAKSAVTLGWSS